MLGHGMRGQALVETALFLPLFLLGLFGIIYVSQSGVLGERTQTAVRYGGIVAFASLGTNYGAANIYASRNLLLSPSSCAPPAAAVLTYAAPFPGPTSHPYWNPSGTPAATCTVVIANFGKKSPSYFAVVSQSMTVGVSVPAAIRAAIGAASTTTGASQNFVHAAYPAVIMYCDKTTNDLIVGALSGVTPTPGPVPPSC